MTPTQKAALLALADMKNSETEVEPEELRGTGWVAHIVAYPLLAQGWDVILGAREYWRLTPAGRGAVEALRAGARVDSEPRQRELPIGQGRLI